MSVRRKKDPAGLLPDIVQINFEDPQPGDSEALRRLLAAASPSARIARLRRYEQLKVVADALAARLIDLSGSMDHALDADITRAELHALYFDAAGPAIEKVRRKVAASALSDKDISNAVSRHETLKAAAAYLGISERQLRNRRRIIGRKS